MKPAIPITLAVLALCAFGAGPFWGENKGPTAAPPQDLTISNFKDDCEGSQTGEFNGSCDYDAGTASGLIVAVCGTLATGTPILRPTTVMTYDGVSMTQLLYIPEQVLGGGYSSGAIYYLNNPSSGVNELFVDWEGTGRTTSWSMIPAQLTGQAVVQDGATDITSSQGSTTITNTISGHTTSDLVYHFGCWRGGDRSDPASNPLTLAATGKSGITGASDVQWVIGTDFDASPTTNTISFNPTENVARTVGGMLPILPQ